MKKYEKQVSVVMGVYNQWDQEILHKAVNSILKQTLSDFEFIIYDDGSTKEVAAYIRKLTELDERIVVIGQEKNHGLAFSLNACIKHAKGKYIARMDADDISMPERLQEQVEFLENHPQYMWCGCNAEVFDEHGAWGQRIMPEVPTERDYLKYSPYIHPSVVYRASIFEEEQGYLVSKETLRCEDYEIFMRLHQMGYRGYNIQRKLFCYRENEESYQKRRFKYRINEAKVRGRNFKEMGILFPKGWIYVLRPIIGGLVPCRVLSRIKRNELKGRPDLVKVHESKNEVLQYDITK